MKKIDDLSILTTGGLMKRMRKQKDNGAMGFGLVMEMSEELGRRLVHEEKRVDAIIIDLEESLDTASNLRRRIKTILELDLRMNITR